jgi:HPt (histidine-containing phosphotransfer) domain-containing protein
MPPLTAACPREGPGVSRFPRSDEPVGTWLANRVPVYLGEREADVNAIERALGVDDFQSIQKIGHNMKGSGSSYGFSRITEIGDRLESAAKEGNRAEIVAVLRDLNCYLRSIKPESLEVNNHTGATD